MFDVIRDSPWNQRAWTYQEGVLSPRCLYFAEGEVYFECNLVHCRESISETNSSLHNASIDQLEELLRFTPWPN